MQKIVNENLEIVRDEVSRDRSNSVAYEEIGDELKLDLN